MDALAKRVRSLWATAQAALPEDERTQWLLAGGTLSVAAVVLYPLAVHYALGRQVRHTHPNASARAAAVECGELTLLPKPVLETPRAYRFAHDKVDKVVPHFFAAATTENQALFTQLLRNNMRRFARTIQSYMLKRALKGVDAATFSDEHIDGLEFRPGDVVCGCYVVRTRSPLSCELAIELPREVSPVSGLLLIRLYPAGEGAVLSSETVQWVAKSHNVVLPLERWLFRFMHSMTSRRLVVAGVEFLQRSSEDDRS